VAQFVSFDALSSDELARLVTQSLAQGPVVLPVAGAYAVVTGRREHLGAKFVASFVAEPGGAVPAAWPFAGDARYRAGIERLVARGAVAVFGPERIGLLAGDGQGQRSKSGPRTQSAEGRGDETDSADFWVSIPFKPMGPGQLVEELAGAVSLVVTGSVSPAGPTVVDLTARPAVVDRRGNLGILHVEQELGGLVRLGPGIDFEVLVVCTGNSCRSPMAEGLLAKMLAGEPVRVRSAGTGAPAGLRASNQAIAAAGEHGVDLVRHWARLLTGAMIESADLVLVMERYHRERVIELAPGAARKTKLLLSYAGRDVEVDDPVGRPTDAYRRTIERMMPALERVAADIKFRLGRQS
jgi:protein-tyrosine-phosphatase